MLATLAVVALIGDSSALVGICIPKRYSDASPWLTGGKGLTLMVGRRRGGGGVQVKGWELVMPSAARMSAWAHPCDQHLAQALPSMYPTETLRFFPWCTGHFRRRVPSLDMEVPWSAILKMSSVNL